MLAERMSAPVKTVQTSKGMGTENDVRSMLEIPSELVMTAFKRAEDSDNRIIRIFNPTSSTVTGKISGEIKKAWLVNMNEEYVGEIDLENVVVAPYKILTIEVELA